MTYYVKTPTQAEYDKLMEMYEVMGWVWKSGDNPKKIDEWSEYKKQTAVDFYNNFGYSSVIYFESEYGTSITLQEAHQKLLEIASPEQQTKLNKIMNVEEKPTHEPQFKRGDLVEVRNFEQENWEKSIYLETIHGAVYPHVFVTPGYEEAFKSGQEFQVMLRRHIRPLKTTYTKAEIAEKLGVDVEKLEIVE